VSNALHRRDHDAVAGSALLTYCHVSRRRSVEWGDSGGQFGSREPILMPHCGHCSVREAAVGAYWSSITS